jgi:hypothetical protein
VVRNYPSFVCVEGLMMGENYYLESFSRLIYGGLWASVPLPNYLGLAELTMQFT